MDSIRSGKVPGKAQCMECIESSPAALKGRSWEGVGLSRYHKMSYDTIPAEVSRYQVVSRYHPCSVVSLKLNSTK